MVNIWAILNTNVLYHLLAKTLVGRPKLSNRSDIGYESGSHSRFLLALARLFFVDDFGRKNSHQKTEQVALPGHEP